MSQFDLNADHQPNYPTEIIFKGEHADLVWERIKEFPELWEGLDEVDPANPTDTDLAKALAFCQVASFGESGRHNKRHGSRLGRNLELIRHNRDVIGLSETVLGQTLVLEGYKVSTEIEIGFFDGATIIYPLNQIGWDAYRNNRLPPHDFVPKYLVSDQSFQAASASFIGGAIHLPSISDDMIAKADGKRAHFKPNQEPAALCAAIGKRITAFAPTTRFIWDNDMPTLVAGKENDLPVIVSAISGHGHGENTLVRLHFLRDAEHPVDRVSGDTRYIFDLNDLSKRELAHERRAGLLGAWAWFWESWQDANEFTKNLNAVAKQFFVTGSFRQ